jgi:murein DD-endopeptidase MepM/ murein hydrolase activator NlpD
LRRFLQKPNPVFLVLLSLAGFAAGETAGAQEAAAAGFPSIERLENRDPVFKQYLADVELARGKLFGRRNSLDAQELAGYLRIYVYAAPAEGEDFFRLSARCNVPYAGLATLNRIGYAAAWKGPVLLPSMPGIFVPETPENDLEQLIASSRDKEEGVVITLPGNGGSRRFLFFPGADFSPTERSYFLNPGFRYPLRTYRITSPFGTRPSPFTGRPQRHNGLDLAAPLGTEVYPAREGTVADLGSDAVYGNYVIIAHNDNWVSLYGHLSAINVTRRSAVTRNSVIGRVGSTGQSTGPHLHFELRKNGAAQDPGKLLFKGQ